MRRKTYDLAKAGKNEQEIMRSEALFKGITEQTNQGIILLDYEGMYVLVNKAFSEMTHYSDKELHNMTLFDLIDVEYGPRLMPTVKKHGECQKEIRLVRKNGGQHAHQTRSSRRQSPP